MRMRFLVVPALMLSMLLCACQEPSADAKKAPEYVVVDLGRLVRDSEAGKSAQAFLEGIQKNFNDRLVGMQEKLQKDPQNADLAKEMQGVYMGLQQRMQAEEQNVNNVLLDHILRVIKAYREKNGLGMVVRSEAVMDYDKSLDRTDALLDAVNSSKVEFTPVTQDPAPAKDETAAAAPAAGTAPAAAPAPAEAPAKAAAPAKADQKAAAKK